MGENPGAVEIRLLGPLEVTANGRALELGGGRQRALLAVLALRAGQVVSTDVLVESLWGDQPPPTAHKALQGLISQLRRALSPLGDGVIATRPPGYVLHVDSDAIDVHRFERLAALGRAAVESDPRSAGEQLREALALWRGEALAEFAYEPFAQVEIGRLAELRLSASEDRFDAELALGRHGEAIAELQALVAANPLRERLRGQLMLALYRSGRQAEALEVYREGRQVLARELGLEPDAELRRLEQAILAQDPALGRVEKLRPPRPATGRRRRLAVAVAVAVVAVACVAAAVAFAVAERGGATPAVVPNSLVQLDIETGEVEDVIPVGRDPGQVALVGPYVFVTSQEDKTLHRVDTRTGDVETSGANATDGALVADGEFLWATSVSRAEAVRIHSGTLAATERVPLARDLLFAFVYLGAGSLWISQFPPAAVLRVNLKDHRLERRYDLGFSEPPVETTFAEGASWTAVGAALLRVDARTGRSESIAAGPWAGDPEFAFGSMWAGSAGGSAVWRIDPVTGRTTATVRAGKVTFGLAAGAGSMWVTNYCEGTVSRIDPATNAVVATVETGYQPKWLAVDARRVWVGVSGTKYPELGCDQPVRG